MSEDEELAAALSVARQCHVVVIVRGTEEKPVLRLIDKRTKARVDSNTLARRMKGLKNHVSYS